MTNKKLIEKIVQRIGNKSHKLSKPITIDDEILTDITINCKESGSYKWCVTNDYWELPLCLLKNRELIKLYQSL
jgi:hypothetical protein